MGHVEEEVNLSLPVFWVTYPILYNLNGETIYEYRSKYQCSPHIAETMPSFSKYREKLNVRCQSIVNTHLASCG